MMLTSAKVTKSSASVQPAKSVPSASTSTNASPLLPPTPSTPSPSPSSSRLSSNSEKLKMPSTNSSPSSSASSSRNYSRDLSRLRRMCPSHQPCVVYSNRELASEIKSIVSAAKTGPSTAALPPSAENQQRLHQPATSSVEKYHQKRHNAKSETAPNAASPSTSKAPKNKITSTIKPSSTTTTTTATAPTNTTAANAAKTSQTGNKLPKTGVGLHVRPLSASGAKPDGSQTAEEKAYIDSFTTHGPGIFSGTFSGKKIKNAPIQNSIHGYALVRPFLYFDPPTLFRAKLYFD